MNNTLLKKDTILIDNLIEEKISEFENDIKNNKITWHTIEEMNQVIDGVVSSIV